MNEIGKAIKTLIDKMIDFFDIFDLSFFVSGATFSAAVGFAAYTLQVDLPRELRGGLGVIALVLICYVSGMLCFALGRFTRRVVQRRDEDEMLLLIDLIKQHGLERHEEIKGYLDRNAYQALYVRLWVEVRQRGILTPSFTLLRRYWVSAATLDGLTVAVIAWAVAGAVWVLDHQPVWTGKGVAGAIVGLGGLLAFALVSAREAQRYERYQREELIATIAQELARERQQNSDASGSATGAGHAPVINAGDTSD